MVCLLGAMPSASSQRVCAACDALYAVKPVDVTVKLVDVTVKAGG